MGFADKITAESQPHDVKQIVTEMVDAALRTTSFAGDKKASLFTTAPSDIANPKILERDPDLESGEIERIPADIREKLIAQAERRTQEALENAASRFTSEVNLLALMLYIQATNPKADISHALRMQKGAIERTAEEWLGRAQLDKVFDAENGDPTRFMESTTLNNMVNALETNMRQFLREKNISQEIAVTPY